MRAGGRGGAVVDVDRAGAHPAGHPFGRARRRATRSTPTGRSCPRWPAPAPRGRWRRVQRDHRAERLVQAHGHLGGDALEHGRLVHERTEVGTGPAAREHGRPLGDGVARRGRDGVELGRRAERPDVDRVVVRLAHGQLPGRPDEFVAELAVHVLVHQHPLDVDAHLTGVGEGRGHAAGRRPWRRRRPRARSAGSSRRARARRRSAAAPARSPTMRPVRGRPGEADVVDARRSGRSRPSCRGRPRSARARSAARPRRAAPAPTATSARSGCPPC